MVLLVRMAALQHGLQACDLLLVSQDGNKGMVASLQQACITQEHQARKLFDMQQATLQLAMKTAPVIYLVRCRLALTNGGVAHFFVIVLSRVGVQVGLLLMGYSELPFPCLDEQIEDPS